MGDIEVMETGNDAIFEAVENKCGQIIKMVMIRNAYDKFRQYTVDRYYILSAKEGESIGEITEKVIQIQTEHGCQVIGSGIPDTIKYYLRLVRKPEIFVSNYVTLVEKGTALRFEHRKAWNYIVSGGR